MTELQPAAGRPLDYADPARTLRTRNPKRNLHVAIACGLVPAVVGTVTTALWLATRSSLLPLVGLLTLTAGPVLCLVGAAHLTGFVWKAYRARVRPVGPWLKPALVAAGVLAFNFPLSLACMEAASWDRVRVFNNTGLPVTGFVLSDGSGRTWRVATVPPGGQRRRLMMFSGGGRVTFSANANGTTVADAIPAPHFAIIGYDRTVTFNADGTVSSY